MGAVIAGAGKALPKLVVTNDDLATLVDTSDEWIVPRTGIHERRIAVDESTTDLASAACAAALGMDFDSGLETAAWAPAAIDPESIDLIVCSTVSGDMVVPSQAALVRARLGLVNAAAFDVNAACAGCVYATTVAENLMFSANARQGAQNPIKRALVVGAERLTHCTDWTDRNTCVLFGDGAGALVLEWDEEAPGIMSTFVKNTDDPDLSLVEPNPLRTDPMPFDENGVVAPSADGTQNGVFSEINRSSLANPYIQMDGRAVFKFATSALAEAVNVALDRAQVSIDDVACVVPHQANERIIRNAAKKLGKDMDFFQVSIGSAANTSSASALMALCDAFVAGRINPGDYVVVCGFGGGLTSGAFVFKA